MLQYVLDAKGSIKQMEKTAQGKYDAEKAIRFCQTRNIREITLILYNLSGLNNDVMK